MKEYKYIRIDEVSEENYRITTPNDSTGYVDRVVGDNKYILGGMALWDVFYINELEEILDFMRSLNEKA